MELFKIFKIDVWWKSILLCGIALVAAGLMFENMHIVNPKHLIGLGIGFFGIGIAMFMANKHINRMVHGGILSTQKTIHNPVTIAILIAGIAITAPFLVLLLIGLAR